MESNVNASPSRGICRGSSLDNARIREEAACWTLALREKNVTRVLEHYGPDAVTFGLGAPLLPSADPASRRATLSGWFDTWVGPIDIEIKNLRLELGAERAFAYSTNHLSGKQTCGNVVSLWFRSTVVYGRWENRWLIVHEHQSVPFDTVTQRACLDLKP